MRRNEQSENDRDTDTNCTIENSQLQFDWWRQRKFSLWDYSFDAEMFWRLTIVRRITFTSQWRDISTTSRWEWEKFRFVILLFLTTNGSEYRNWMHFEFCVVFLSRYHRRRVSVTQSRVKHSRKSIIFLPIFSFPYFSRSQVDDSAAASVKGLFLVDFGWMERSVKRMSRENWAELMEKMGENRRNSHSHFIFHIIIFSNYFCFVSWLCMTIELSSMWT